MLSGSEKNGKVNKIGFNEKLRLNLNRYKSDEKMNKIFENLTNITQIISQNAHMRSMYDEMLSLSKEEHKLEKKDPTSIETLERYLKEAKEAVIKTVVDTEKSKDKFNKKNNKRPSWKFWKDDKFWKVIFIIKKILSNLKYKKGHVSRDIKKYINDDWCICNNVHCNVLL